MHDPVVVHHVLAFTQQSCRQLWLLKNSVRDMAGQGVSGIVFRPVDYYDNSDEINYQIAATIKMSGIPLVLLDCNVRGPPQCSGLDAVGVDNMMVGMTLGRHAVERGAVRVMFVSRARASVNVRLRRIGIKAVLDGVRGGRCESFKWIAPRDYGELVENRLRHWRRLCQDSPIKFFPSMSTGYDPRLWVGAVDAKIATNAAAAAFWRICEDAKKFSDETDERYLLMGPLDEWGEGSIWYPNRQHGFGMLEAVRDTFGEKPPEGWPVNCSPEDVGLVCPQRR